MGTYSLDLSSLSPTLPLCFDLGLQLSFSPHFADDLFSNAKWDTNLSMASKNTDALRSLPLRLRRPLEDVKDSHQSVVGSGEATLTALDQATSNELSFTHQAVVEAGAPPVADLMETTENQANSSHTSLLNEEETPVTDPVNTADGATAPKPQVAVDGGKPPLSTPVQAADDQADSTSQPAVSDGDITLTQPSQAADEQAKLACSVQSSVIEVGEAKGMTTVDLVAPKRKKKRKPRTKPKHGKVV